MRTFRLWLFAGALLSALLSQMALAQSPTKVRGIITGINGHVLEIKASSGSELKVNIDDRLEVSSISALQLSDIKQGSFVGVSAARKKPGGVMYALEVHIFPESMRGTGEGHRDWDLEPGSTMTNANVAAIVEANDGKELTLNYRGGEQKIVVPPGTPVVTFGPGDISLLKVGAQVFCTVQRAANGTLTALHIRVGKDGVKPPM